MKNRDLTKANFDSDARSFDERILKHVPGYLDMHEALLRFIPFQGNESFTLLDLGIGTGNLAKKVLERFPGARVTGVDFSEQMINICRERLARFADRLTLINMGFDRELPPGKHNVVTMNLSLHHLENREKERLIKQVSGRIIKPGALLIGDLVKSRSKRITDVYMNIWKENMRSHGFSEEYIEKSYEKKKYETEDIPAPVEDHLYWLKKAGFDEVELFWKRFHFAAFGGFKGIK
ncbi:MAG: methyltransferase domain-containing protein [Candidatus Margulisbacteria bacterium]|nr:methyltransferase domain-containing protein [Candidatus Margulisiibacteriota bacterium]